MKAIRLWLSGFFVAGSLAGLNAQNLLWSWESDSVNQASAPFAATFQADSLAPAWLRRGPGLSASSLANAYSSSSWSTASAAQALRDGHFLALTLVPDSAFSLSLSSLDFNFRRSSTGPDSLRWYYSLDSLHWQALDSVLYFGNSPSNGAAFGPINLSGVAALQNRPAGAPIYLRLCGWNASSAAGTGAIGRLAGPDLRIWGQRSSLSGPAAPQSLSATALSTTRIQVQAQPNATGDSLLILAHSQNQFPTPTGIYQGGDSLNGGVRVIYFGAGPVALNHDSLRPNQLYHYRAYSFRQGQYSLARVAQAQTLSGLLPGLNLQDSSRYRIDFDQSLTGVNEGPFGGSGFSPNPSWGQLNSNAWQIRGLSDGDLEFGASGSSGDFARGLSTGGSFTGGIYSFERDSANFALGWQATGSDMAPGYVYLRLNNATADTIRALSLAYSLYEYNDQTRSSGLALDYSFDLQQFTADSTMVAYTEEQVGGPVAWRGLRRITRLTDLAWPPGQPLYLRWSSTDHSGSGSRDEMALDDIEVQIAGPQADAILAQDAQYDQLTVGERAQLQLQPGSHLEIGPRAIRNEGLIQIQSGACLLQSDSLDGNSGGGRYQVERSIWAADRQRYSFWSSPVKQAYIDSVFANTNPLDRYRFSPDTTAAGYQSFTSGLMEVGEGYALTPAADQALVSIDDWRRFEGQVNNGRIQFFISGTSTGDYVLLGNPYPSALDFRAFAAANPDIHPTVYYWDASPPALGESDFAYWNASGPLAVGNSRRAAPSPFIPSGQGFMVKVNRPGNHLFTFENSMRRGRKNQNQRFFKKEAPALRLALQHEGGTISYTLLAFRSEATEAWDAEWDAERFAAHQFHSLYSFLDSRALSIQALPPLYGDEERWLSLGLDLWQTGAYQLKIDSLINWPQDWQILLQDSSAASSHDLQAGPWSFYCESSRGRDRSLRLLLRPKKDALLGTTEARPNAKELQWHQRASALHLRWPTDSDPIRALRLYNLAGQLVAELSVSAGVNSIEWSLPNLNASLYLISLERASGARQCHKVYFQSSKN